MNKLNEGLIHGDLKGLVSDVMLVDKHKPKLGQVEDTVVVGLRVLYQEPAQDLANFIESGMEDHLDVEVSDSPTRDGQWLIFIEFMRDHNLFKNITKLTRTVEQVTAISEKWYFRPFGTDDKMEWNKENFDMTIIDSSSKYIRDILKESLTETWTRKLKEYQKTNA
jgi:hypothetical protein